MASSAFSGMRRDICVGVLAILFLTSFGCATAPRPVTIENESTPSRNDAAVKDPARVTEDLNKRIQEQGKGGVRQELPMEAGKGETAAAAPEWARRVRFGGDIRLRDENDHHEKNNSEPARPAMPISVAYERAPSRKEPADRSVAELAELLKSKNVISADEAARFTEHYATPVAGGQGTLPASEGVAGLAALLESKNVISAEEALSFMGRNVTLASGGQGDASEINDKGKIDKITANVTRELMKGLRESEKDQVEKITARVTEEVKKGLWEQVKSEVLQDLPKGVKKGDMSAGGKDAFTSDKEQIVELNQKVSYVEQKVAELLYGGKVAELAAAAPEQTRRIRFGGDIRLRYESDRFDKNNAIFLQPSNPTQVMNTTSTQDRFKYRVRAGVETDIAEDMTGNAKMQGVFRLSTGNTSNPVSTNTLLGVYLNKSNVVLDQAYLKFTWKTMGDAPTVYTVYGGRIPNPWFSSDLVWDSDLNFDGLALNVKKPLTDTESWTSFLTAGAFPLQYDDFSNKGKWLAAGQVGVERKDRTGVAARIGAAYYYYSNITGVANNPLNPGATDWTAPMFQQKGNTLFNISADPTAIKTALASEFKELNLTGTLNIGFWDPVHIVLLGDYVENLGFNKSKVARLTGLKAPTKETTGYQIGMSVSRPAIETYDRWSPPWKMFLNYKYLESDAVVDAFTDSDFHLGGTNAKGWILGAEYGLMKNTWLTLRWLTSNEISGPPLRTDVLQVDFNAKF